MPGGQDAQNEKGISMRKSIFLSSRTRSTLSSLTAIAMVSAAAPAMAQEEEGSEFTVSGNAAIVSEYRFRGVGFSDGDIAIQGGVDVSHESGFYIGTWGSSLEEGTTVPNFGHTELDIYGGWSGDIASGLSADVGLLYYAFPNSTNGFSTDYLEAYGSLSTTLGPVEATVGLAYAFDNSALAGDNVYVYGGLSAGIPETPITLNANLGYTDGSLDVSGSGNYLDWNLGADFAITENLTISAQYIDTDAPSVNNVTDSTFVFTLAVSF